MEFCSGGSCADLMKPGLINEDYISIIVRELLLGLDYLHSDKKLHRDVKGMYLSFAPVHTTPSNTPQPPMFSSRPTDRSSSLTLAFRASSLRQ